MLDKANNLLQMYKNGVSGVLIADKLELPVRQVYRILEKNGIARRTSAHSNSLRFFREAPTFRIKIKMNFEEKLLWISGLMLYWAEGSHYEKKHILDFANSNPDMVKIFLRFLREVCGVDEKRLRVYLYCYANQDIGNIKKFWSKVTNISLKQFTRPYIRYDFRQEKIGKMPHGLAHIRYADKKLYIQIENWQSEALNLFLGQVVP